MAAWDCLAPGGTLVALLSPGWERPARTSPLMTDVALRKNEMCLSWKSDRQRSLFAILATGAQGHLHLPPVTSPNH
jgi:hypothetical protein